MYILAENEVEITVVLAVHHEDHLVWLQGALLLNWKCFGPKLTARSPTALEKTKSYIRYCYDGDNDKILIFATEENLSSFKFYMYMDGTLYPPSIFFQLFNLHR